MIQYVNNMYFESWGLHYLWNALWKALFFQTWGSNARQVGKGWAHRADLSQAARKIEARQARWKNFGSQTERIGLEVKSWYDAIQCQQNSLPNQKSANMCKITKKTGTDLQSLRVYDIGV